MIVREIYPVRDRQAYCLYIQTENPGVPEPPKFTVVCSTEREVKTKTNNKTKMIAMRFRESDYEVIKRKADKADLNFTEFVTRSALDMPIVVIDSLSELLKEQKAIGRNLNQLTTLCNMGKITCPDLSELISQYTSVYDRLNDISERCE